jgi:hypothetical protein
VCRFLSVLNNSSWNISLVEQTLQLSYRHFHFASFRNYLPIHQRFLFKPLPLGGDHGHISTFRILCDILHLFSDFIGDPSGSNCLRSPRKGGRLKTLQDTLRHVVYDQSGRKSSNALFSHAHQNCYMYVRWPTLYSTIPPLFLLCCFYFLMELRYLEDLGFFGEYSGNLSSGPLLTTSRDRPPRAGGKVPVKTLNFM